MITIGSDPEFVVLNENGVPVGAPNALGLGQTLANPKIKTRYGEVFADNANVEASVNYGRTRDEFIANLKGCISVIDKAINRTGERKNTIHSISSLDYPKKELEHPICRLLGCSPDYNALHVKQNEIPAGAVDRTFRSAGGHIHLGSDVESDVLHDFQGRLNTVKAFESILGITGLFIDNSDASIKRRTLYGACFSHRPKEYGVECRSLSNFWVQTPELAGYVYDSSKIAIVEATENNIIPMIDMHKLEATINTGNIIDAAIVRDIVFDRYPSVRDGYEGIRQHFNLDRAIPLTDTWGL